jgi:NADH-quinone oxidoreductase subunit L
LAPEGGTALPLLLVTETLQVAGILLAYRLYLRRPRPRGERRQAPVAASLRALWLSGWGFDWLYDRLFVAPLSWFARVNRRDAIDTLYAGLAGGLEALSLHASRTQTGRIRWYASGIAVGAIIVLGIVVLS